MTFLKIPYQCLDFTLFFLKTYLFWNAESNISHLLLYFPWVRVGPDKSQEPRLLSRSPTWVEGTNVLESSSAAFPGTLAEAGLEVDQLGLGYHHR